MLKVAINNKLLRLAMTAGVTLLGIYLLWQFSDRSNLLEIIKGLNPLVVGLAFFLYFLNLLAKAARFRFILKNKISLKKILSIVFIQSFGNNALPFKAGEITYLYMVNEEKDISGGENIISLFLARVFDILIVSTVFLISGFLIFRQQSNFLESVPLPLVAFLLLFGVVILSGAIFYRQRLSQFFSSLSFKNQFLNRLCRLTAETFLALNQISNFKKLAIFTAFSFLILILDTLSIWAVLFSAGARLSFVEVAFLALFPALVSAFPVLLVGNFGAFEGTVTSGLVLLGISVEKALNFSLVFHLQILLFSFVLFTIAFWYRSFLNKKVLDSQAELAKKW